MRSAFVAIAVLATALLPATAHATFPGENGKIAYAKIANPTPDPGDIYVVEPDGSNDTQLTTNPFADRDPAWSPDGTRIAFTSRSTSTGPSLIWVMNADGTGKTQITTPGSPVYDDLDPAWKDNQRIAFVRRPRNGDCSTIMRVDSNGSFLQPLVSSPECGQSDIAFSPDGSKLAYFGFTTNEDTQGLYVDDFIGPPTKILDDGNQLNWSPGGIWLGYSVAGDMFRTTPDGVHRSRINSFNDGPVWSPDGSRIVVGGLRIYNDAGTDEQAHDGLHGTEADWQALPPQPVPGYARPQAASPVTVSLVPAYVHCGERMWPPNREHGPPLAFGSCAPPVPRSDYLTVGTADSNAAPSKSTGQVKIKAIVGDPGSPDFEADVGLAASMTDVRCAAADIPCTGGALSDYTGALRLHFAFGPFAVGDGLTITDKFNGGSGRESATYSFTQFAPMFAFDIPCDPTVGGDGSTCAANTTVNALLPGAVIEAKRATWQFGRIWLLDGGADGDPATDDNTLFASQGVFVP